MGGQAKSKKRNPNNNKPRRRETRSNGGAGLVGLTSQERMKVKMQEKAKKKTAEKYSVEQLLEKTEECMDNFDLQMARLFCQRALDIEPSSLRILEMLGNICAELGDVDKAKQVFLKAAELSPDQGHSKYMYLGQIHTGREAISYFSKGIEIMTDILEKDMQGASPEEAAASASEGGASVSGRDVCLAFCSVAEIYFTDLCMEDGAADQCKESITKALQYDPLNPEALQLMASYLFSTQKTEEGRDYLLKSVSSWLPSLRKGSDLSTNEQEESAQGEEPPPPPPYEARITTSKLLVEAEEHEKALEVLEMLLEEDDEVMQVWYLLGWVCYLRQEKPDCPESENYRDCARTYLTRAKKLYVKLCCDDPPMLEHMQQLLTDLRSAQGGDANDDDDDDDDEDEDTVPLDDIADDFIQSSEEEDSMEH
ncbi:probable assembly chaperone of rpl4 [Denticeps clupeoides]|uniref:Uncharacterized protein n=1 Tax=Denticeps clupeoides TaxID=299321 RepID=A0AAY4BXY6_9TELE|nr:probable assembly chaperone of rpl4 [Denticeps clupeoides]